MKPSEVCRCPQPELSGRWYGGREACRICALVVVTQQQRDAADKARDRVVNGRREPRWVKTEAYRQMAAQRSADRRKSNGSA